MVWDLSGKYNLLLSFDTFQRINSIGLFILQDQIDDMIENLSLQSKGLSFSFSDGSPVLKSIDLNVPKGSIYGFLGPNGAGKTTTLKLVLGLLKIQQGQIDIFGKDLKTNRVPILRRVGSLIESPSLYGHLSAVDNLKVWKPIYRVTDERIQEVLDLVDLAKTGKKKAKNFSLGMKQRLSIAIAMLHNPELLILDEPTNGLDPNGILEMRQLLKKINEETGVTILISSHLLAEIEKLVTHVGIIHRGEMIFQGTLKELNQKQKQGARCRIRTSDSARSLDVLKEAGVGAELLESQLWVDAQEDGQIAAVTRALFQAGLDVYEVSMINDDLEQIFMDLTNDTV